MTIYRAVLRYGGVRPTNDGTVVIHTKRRPLWSVIRAAIEEHLVDIAEKMDEDGREDYESLASRRAELRRLKGICPARMAIANPDDMAIDSGRLTITEIEVR